MRMLIYLKRLLASLKINLASWYSKYKAPKKPVADMSCGIQAQKDLDDIEHKIELLQKRMQLIIDESHCYSKKLVS